ncbi:MAG TPA: NB-ARC domain-containing protein [Pseudonocardiaceae bacterium]|jgi:hypothetical protein
MTDQPGNESADSPPTDTDTIQTTGELADRLRRLRRRHARRRGDSPLTYRELASRTGWAHGVIGDYFTGKTLPPIDRFDVLVGLLGATRSEIVALANARDRVEELRRKRSTTRQPATKVTPRELPGYVAGFTGRAAQLAELDDTEAPVVVLSGAAGVGKTALATYWARRAGTRFPDGCLYVDLRGYGQDHALPADDALAMLLRDLGLPGPVVPTHPAERAARYRGLAAQRRLLVLLDNANSVDQVRPLLPGTASCRMLVTTREPLVGLVARHGARRIELAPLSINESIALLHALIGRRVTEQPMAARSLAAVCRGMPLALRIAAEYVVAHPEDPLAILAQDWSTLASIAADAPLYTA